MNANEPRYSCRPQAVESAVVCARSCRRPESLRTFIVISGWLFIAASAATAQSLDELHDEEQYLRGLTELQLPEVLERYLELHPPDDAVGAVMHQQALDRLAAREAARSIAEREAIIERMMARADELIEQHPDDPRRARWIADQAGDLYFEMMMLDASMWTAMLGVPSPEQEQRVRRAAARMMELTDLAERTVIDVMFQMEAQPEFGDSPALQRDRRQLADEYRDRRVPFLRGIAMHVHARFNVESRDDRKRLARFATETLNDVIPRLDGRLKQEASIHAGFARLLEGDFERAADDFSQVISDNTASPLLRFAAAIGHSHITAWRSGTAAALNGIDRAARDIGVSDQLFYQLLFADQRIVLHDQPGDESYRPYLRLIDQQPSPRREVVRRAVLDRLSGHHGRFPRASDMPALVRIAHAHAIARHEGRIDEAIQQLESWREGAAIGGDESALALLVLGRLCSDADRPLDAARHLLEVAHAHATHPDAAAANESALVHAAEAYRRSPSEARPPLRDALDTLFSRYPESDTTDHWRMVAGRLALSEHDYDEALRHFERIAPTAKQQPEAKFMQVEALRRAAQGAANPTVRYGELLHRIDRIEADLRREAPPVAPDEQVQSHLALLRVYRAEAHLALGDAQQALEELEQLNETEALPANVIAELLPIRIRALEAVGRTDLASEELDRLLGASPERVLEVLLPMVDAAARRVEALIHQHQNDEARDLAQRELLPMARRLEAWHNQHGGEHHSLAIGRRLADAYRLSGEHDDALAWYDRLLEDQPNAMSLLLGRAECLFLLGEDADDPRLAEAMTIYRRIATAATDSGDAYWLSQLRMLQILDRIDRNTDRIPPRIQQLRQRDRSLGGEYYRRHFDRLQTRHSR